MAKVAKNALLHGASGMFGDQIVIRQRAGMTILAQPPGERQGEPTAGQRAHEGRFQQAIIYGRSAIKDAAEKAAYKEKAKPSQSAFNVAVADFFHAPSIDEIDLTAYTGQVGDTIRVRAVDDFRVVQVHVSISNADGSLVEQGDAVQQANQVDWLYTATAANESTEGDRIVIRASDKPSNISEAEQAM
jgi:hypothetical protein